MEIPKISSKSVLTLAEAVAEYQELTHHQNNAPSQGWAKKIAVPLGSRLTWLRRTIADLYVQELSGKGGKDETT